MSTVTRPSGCALQLQHPVHGVCTVTVSRSRQPAVAHELQEAARAVAAMLDLVTVGVVDHVLEVDAAASGDGRTLRIWSAPTPKWRSAEKPVVGRAQSQRAAGLVQHDEVVARTLHLGKGDSHRRIIPLKACRRRAPTRRRRPRDGGTMRPWSVPPNSCTRSASLRRSVPPPPSCCCATGRPVSRS
jgi:hypothetical protein